MEVAMKLLSHNQRAKHERQQHENQVDQVSRFGVAQINITFSEMFPPPAPRCCLQVCPVCFDELPGSRGIFLSCGHFGCWHLSLPWCVSVRVTLQMGKWFGFPLPTVGRFLTAQHGRFESVWSLVSFFRSRLPTTNGQPSYIRGSGHLGGQTKGNPTFWKTFALQSAPVGISSYHSHCLNPISCLKPVLHEVVHFCSGAPLVLLDSFLVQADVTALRCPVPDCRVGFDVDVLRKLFGLGPQLWTLHWIVWMFLSFGVCNYHAAILMLILEVEKTLPEQTAFCGRSESSRRSMWWTCKIPSRSLNCSNMQAVVSTLEFSWSFH